MVVAIVGLGVFGVSMALKLIDEGAEVFAIDKEEEKVRKYANFVTHAVAADVTDRDAMESIGIRNADVAVITTASNITMSVMGTMILKELGIPNVIAKAKDEMHGRILQAVGASRVVYPEKEAGERLAHSILSNNFIDLIELDPRFSILEIKAPEKVVGRTLKQIDVRAKYGVNIVAVKSGNNWILTPGANDIIKQNDILVTIGSNEDLERFKE
ncbi:MAG TPA: TrkA family potassium uptake protein [Bacillota bacterium]|nr:MAG: Ktr system potassium uptake protein A [Firmicutes bacterium ADurb.Bin153]HNV35066.1 TrkA family potassium uptake protein [Bacillota bacterium]